MSGTLCLLLEILSLAGDYLFGLWSGTICLVLEELSLIRDYLFASRDTVSGWGLFVCF